MLRLALTVLLISAGAANAQLLDRRQPTTVFGPNGTITTIIPTPGGFFASDTQGNMATGMGGVITIAPQSSPMPRLAPMMPTLTPPTTSNFD
jgi:hypothetical protein